MYIKAMGALGVVLVIYFGYQYVLGLQNKVDNLTTENTALNISNISITAENLRVEQEIKHTQEKLTRLDKDLEEAYAGKKAIIKLFGDHDFGNLLDKKPKLIENRINKATKRLFKEFTDASN